MEFKNILLFVPFLPPIISFINSCCNFNLDFLSLFGSVATSDFGSAAGFGVDWHVGFWK